MQILFFLLPALAYASHPAPSYGHPKLYCRDTNTSIYAEVCVPAFSSKTTPVTLDVKNIVDDKYCYTAVKTVCEETSTTVTRDICTYNYISKKSTLSAKTTKITYADKSETMKVTTCRPSGYGHGYGKEAGEHQYCREEYQTQAYRVPLVTEPTEVPVELAVPEPVKKCEKKDIVLTEVKCNDIEEERCIKLVKYEDGTNTINQVEVILGEPKCDHVTLTLPTQACSKHQYGYSQ